jgi:hypothetical protein
MSHGAQLVFKTASHYLLPGLASDSDPSMSASQVARITGMHHQAWLLLGSLIK